MKNVNKILTTLSLSASATREDTIKSIIRTTLLESQDTITLAVLKENIDIIYEIELYDVEFNFILKTPHNASLKIPPDILDEPNFLSVNTIGTSTILKPNLHAVNFISI